MRSLILFSIFLISISAFDVKPMHNGESSYARRGCGCGIGSIYNNNDEVISISNNKRTKSETGCCHGNHNPNGYRHHDGYNKYDPFCPYDEE